MGAVTSRPRAHIGDVRNWVEALGVLCCDNMTPVEAEMKTLAYVPMLQADFPPDAFTRDSLSAVARQCKYFPAYGDVYTHLSAWWRQHRPMPVALPEPPPPPQHEPPTPEEAAYVHACVQEVIANMRGPFGRHRVEEEPNNDLGEEPQPPRGRGALYLTPEQLDIVNPLPNGRKRVPELLK